MHGEYVMRTHNEDGWTNIQRLKNGKINNRVWYVIFFRAWAKIECQENRSRETFYMLHLLIHLAHHLALPAQHNHDGRHHMLPRACL